MKYKTYTDGDGMNTEVEEKIKKLGFTLPELPKALGSYLPCIVSGTLAFISGVIPVKDGKVLTGKFGKELTTDDAKEIGKAVVLSILSNIKSAIGTLDKIERVLKIEGFVNSTADFKEQPAVLNEVSNLIVEIFGEKGKHSRIAIGVNSLPLGAAIEVSVIIEIKKTSR